MDENQTSYCGLCCSDCIPSRSALFALADELERMLEDPGFERYAALKAGGTAAFGDYPAFLSLLRAIRSLRCSGPCRSGGGKDPCPVRDCATDRGFSGCWQCGERPACSRLDLLRTAHPHLDDHLDLIRALGPAGWFEQRREHYRWQHRE